MALTDAERDYIASKAELQAIETHPVRWTAGMLIAVALVAVTLGLSEN